MQAMDDMALLQEYATGHSEAAFEALVARWINFVYSAAWRQVHNPHVAEEITQTVFVLLARKAGRLGQGTILSGWLFKTTRFVALAEMRATATRQQREHEAHMESAPPPGPDSVWQQIAPVLDEALAQLGDRDRQAVLLRFFEHKSLAEVGQVLGASQDTAGKRIQRALEKLHRFFRKRGIASSTVMIAGAMAANSVQAAPAGLSAAVAAAGSGTGLALTSSTATLIKATLKLMAWTKLKTTIVVGAGILLVGGGATVTWTVVHYALDAYRAPGGSVAPQTTGPQQVAQAFFDALGKGDWQTVAQLCPPGTRVAEIFNDRVKEELTGLAVVNLGKPFTQAGYPGVFVPYEIRFKNGELKKFRLAVRQDNPERRWYWDGGL
jgi:RNA polymerase sigma factor (sigma-70 family)